MGQTTPNINIYIPADGEQNYGTSFAAGMTNLDNHDHSGPPKGLAINSAGLANGSVTAVKLNSNVVSPGGGLAFDGSNALKMAGNPALTLLNSTGFISQTGANAFSERTLTNTDTFLSITNGDGVAGNPVLGIASAFYTPPTSYTPVLSQATTYSTQEGLYSVIGKLVFFQLNLVINAAGSLDGTAITLSLPITCNATANYIGTVICDGAVGGTAINPIALTPTPIIGRITSGSNQLTLGYIDTNGSFQPLTGTQFKTAGNNGGIAVSGTYLK